MREIRDETHRARVLDWIEALESGDYEQGTNALRPSDGVYCCLGVACDRYRLKTGDGSWERKGDYWTFSIEREELDEEDAYHVSEVEGLSLPESVYLWMFGEDVIDAVDRHDPRPTGEEPLSYYNDSKLLSFGEIAKLLREGLLGEEVAT